MCLQSHLQTSPPTPHKSYPKLRNPRTTFEEEKNFSAHSKGGRGVPDYFFWLESFDFFPLGSHAKSHNPTITPFGFLATVRFMKVMFRSMKVIYGA
jgi:hypothetical protein